MPLELVTKLDAYEHLRIDYDDDGSFDDPWLDIWIPAVSESVALWLKDPALLYEPTVDPDNPPLEPTVRWVVRAAVLTELDSQYQFRAGEGKDNVVPADAGYGYVLNKAATALLAPLRRSTVA